MKKNLNRCQLAGFSIAIIGGTLLHFLYDWTNSVMIAAFSGVNESTWEHMKLLFWPMLLFAIIESFFFNNREDFWYIKLKGILLGLILIPIIFYTYNGVIGKSPDWINISIFFVSAAMAFIYETRQFNRERKTYLSPKFSIIILFLISLAFVIFTFNPPEIAIFKDPLTETYCLKSNV